MSLTSKLPGGRGTAVVLTTGLACVTAYAAVSSGLLSRAISAATTGKQSTSISTTKVQAASAGGIQAGASIKHVGKGPQQYIVVFRDAPLATYKGGVQGIAAPARKGSGSIDAQSGSAQQYVDYLEGKQDAYQASIEQSLGRALAVEMRMQHALNAIVVTLTPQEAEAVARMPNVSMVDSNRHVPLDTDVGPGLIGAPNVWQGIARYFGTADSSARGEGILVGIIDSGINFGSPSFAATDPNDGYVHVNPNGAGTYGGTCVAGQPDEGRCNDKLIAGYDFVCNLTAPAGGTYCSNTATYREEPGFGDTSGHGSHTASTAAGNNRTEVFNGSTVTFSGVAPRANVIAYDVCYTEVSSGRGLCPGAASAAAVNQAIQDGVDVINFSIGGGVSPWNDAVSLAFLNATEAGVFVAASAGNSGPGPATLGHVEPWTTSSAAAQHGRAGYGFEMSITAPSMPPELQNVPVLAGINGVPVAPATGVSFKLSPDFTNTTGTVGDGCDSGDYPAGSLTGAYAVIRRGGCSFTIKTNAAAAAGATGVVIANNAAGDIIPSVPGTTIPAFGMTQASGNAFQAYANSVSNTGIVGNLDPAVITNVADALASFSSRGPSNFDLLKPDITAPGVNVLAAYAGTTITGFENLITTISGTSMASPHTAGAAALMRQLHPSWTVMEIKSALQMAATNSVLLQDQVTPADPHAGGAGRVQVDVAARASLVLNETQARFLAANPAQGGNPAQLNLASLLSANCPTTCTFTRTVRSSYSRRHTWQVSASGLNMTVSPRTFTLNPGQTQEITVTVNNTGAPADGSYRFGRLEFSPAPTLLRDNTLPRLRMNVGVSVPTPPPAPTPITNGQVVPLSGAQGSNQYFSIEVPAGQAQLRVVTTGGTGDLDLYVRRGELPGAAFDCGSESGTNAETCTFNAPVAGTYFIRIAGFTAFSGASLTASYP